MLLTLHWKWQHHPINFWVTLWGKFGQKFCVRNPTTSCWPDNIISCDPGDVAFLFLNAGNYPIIMRCPFWVLLRNNVITCGDVSFFFFKKVPHCFKKQKAYWLIATSGNPETQDIILYLFSILFTFRLPFTLVFHNIVWYSYLKAFSLHSFV